VATTIAHYISGKQATEKGRSIGVISPIDGSSLGEVAVADTALVDRAVQAAGKAYAEWALTPVKERVQPLFRYKSIVEKNLQELAEINSAENGKTIAEAEAGIRKGLECIEYAASLPQLLGGRILEVSVGVDCEERRFPLGVVAGITPFNFPAMVPMWMFPLAIGTGNAFILKPSEQVPLTALKIAEWLTDAGLPDGVFNVLHGDRETVEAILDHPGIAAAAFVGSTPVARAVYRRGFEAGKRILAMAGAKNHLVVVPDADVAATAANVTTSSMGQCGQRCMAASVLVLVGECDHILEAILAEMRKLRLGREMGAIISRKALDRIEGYIERAQKAGAKLLLDGRGATVAGKENGFWLGPTVIDGGTADSEWVKDEIFGPVLSVVRVATLEQALEVEAASPFGNAAAIYTSRGAVARTFALRANSGMIGVNIGVPVPREPFSFGGWNSSRFGAGDVTGEHAMMFWTKNKKITSRWSGVSENWMS
jgi:malonate-semialdehyde dehydrogenase (acetylating)/methylmalonate-semialdehyde dehydrogenase